MQVIETAVNVYNVHTASIQELRRRLFRYHSRKGSYKIEPDFMNLDSPLANGEAGIVNSLGLGPIGENGEFGDMSPDEDAVLAEDKQSDDKEEAMVGIPGRPLQMICAQLALLIASDYT